VIRKAIAMPLQAKRESGLGRGFSPTLSTLRVGTALLGDGCHDLGPASRMKCLTRNTICWDCGEGIKSEVVEHSLQALLLGHAGHTLNSIKKRPRRLLAQKLLKKAPYDVDRQVRLRDPLGIAFGG